MHFFSMQVSLYCSGNVTGIIVMLESEAVINQMLFQVLFQHRSKSDGNFSFNNSNNLQHH